MCFFGPNLYLSIYLSIFKGVDSYLSRTEGLKRGAALQHRRVATHDLEIGR